MGTESLGLCQVCRSPGSCLLHSDCAFISGSGARKLLGLPAARDAVLASSHSTATRGALGRGLPHPPTLPHLQNGIIMVPAAG